MNSSPSRIEAVVNALAEMEKELDTIKADAEEVRRGLIQMAKEEAVRLRDGMIEEANMEMEESLRRIVKENEEKAQELVSKADEKITKLSKKIETRFERAVDLVMKSLLGE